MKTIRSILACAGSMALPLLCNAQPTEEPATSPWAVNLGVKAWANTWTSWEIVRVQSGGGSLQALSPLASDPEIAYTALASVRYRDLFVAASAMSQTQYTLANSLGSIDGTRSETDANIGYELLSGLSLSAGYKRLTQDVGGQYVWSGPTLALSVSAPLQSGLSVYGTVGAGWMKVTLPSPDAAGVTSLNANYTLSEFGLAYTVGREHFGGVANLTVTLGYRAQTMVTQNYALAAQPGGTVYATDDPRDFTQGVTFSLIGTF
jgi:hypothetical protein